MAPWFFPTVTKIKNLPQNLLKTGKSFQLALFQEKWQPKRPPFKPFGMCPQFKCGLGTGMQAATGVSVAGYRLARDRE